MLHFLSGESATLAVQEVVVIDPRAVALDTVGDLGTATIVVDALGINIKGLFLEAVLRNKARLGAPKVDSKFKVSTVVVDTATRVLDGGCTSLLGVINVLGIRRKDLYLEASKFKVIDDL